MSRRPRNKVPAARQVLQPKAVDIKAVKQSNAKEKATQQKYYNRKAGQDLPALRQVIQLECHHFQDLNNGFRQQFLNITKHQDLMLSSTVEESTEGTDEISDCPHMKQTESLELLHHHGSAPSTSWSQVSSSSEVNQSTYQTIQPDNNYKQASSGTTTS